jgi:hypothetical protein
VPGARFLRCFFEQLTGNHTHIYFVGDDFVCGGTMPLEPKIGQNSLNIQHPGDF